MKKLKTTSSGLIGENLSADYNLTRTDTDLLDQNSVINSLSRYLPEFVIQNAGYVAGSIEKDKDDFFYIANNTIIDINVIHACLKLGISNLVLLSSIASNIDYSQDNIRNLLTYRGKAGYAYSKRITNQLVELCNFIVPADFNYKVAVVGNLYGYHSKFDDSNSAIDYIFNVLKKAVINEYSHVQFEIKDEVQRSYTFVNDLDALLCNPDFLKLKETSIQIQSDSKIGFKDLVYLIAKVTNYKGEINFTKSKNQMNSIHLSNLEPNLSSLLPNFSFTNLEDGLGIIFENSRMADEEKRARR